MLSLVSLGLGLDEVVIVIGVTKRQMKRWERKGKI